MSGRKYILFDGRACGGVGTDDATVLVFCDTAEEAHSYKDDFGDAACYSYAVKDGNILYDERWEWDSNCKLI